MRGSSEITQQAAAASFGKLNREIVRAKATKVPTATVSAPALLQAPVIAGGIAALVVASAAGYFVLRTDDTAVTSTKTVIVARQIQQPPASSISCILAGLRREENLHAFCPR